MLHKMCLINSASRGRTVCFVTMCLLIKLHEGYVLPAKIFANSTIRIAFLLANTIFSTASTTCSARSRDAPSDP